MGYKVIQSRHASADIDEIVGYIALKIQNPKAARDMIEQLRRVYETLAEQPYLFPVSRIPRLAESGYRWFRVKSYMGFYTIDDDMQEVHIARIVYGRRNLLHIL
jgi:plasmid stabilization system protein ParE